MRIITGRTGERHVYAIDDAEVNKLFVGSGDWVLPSGNRLNARRSLTRPNVVDILDGSVMMQGRLAKIRSTDGFEEVEIDLGTPNTKRVDIIVAEYYIEDTEEEIEVEPEGEDPYSIIVHDRIEHVDLNVVKGTNGTTYVPPAITTGDIDAGETHQMPLWAVYLDGYDIETLDDRRMFMEDAGIDAYATTVQSLTNRINAYQTQLNNEIDAMQAADADAMSAAIEETLDTWQGITNKINYGDVVTLSNVTDTIVFHPTNGSGVTYSYSSSDVISVYVNGLKLNRDEFMYAGSGTTITVTLTTALTSPTTDDVAEIVVL